MFNISALRKSIPLVKRIGDGRNLFMAWFDSGSGLAGVNYESQAGPLDGRLILPATL
jgi:hypothetical protein